MPAGTDLMRQTGRAEPRNDGNHDIDGFGPDGAGQCRSSASEPGGLSFGNRCGTGGGRPAAARAARLHPTCFGSVGMIHEVSASHVRDVVGNQPLRLLQ